MNTKLDKQRLAAVVPDGLWNQGESPLCEPGQSPCWFPRAGLTLGSAEMTPEAELNAAQFLQRLLQLKEVKREWLDPVQK
jgi:hypothetical protein